MLTVVPPVLRPTGCEPLDAFTAEVNDVAERTRLVIIDCSDFDTLTISAIRMLEAVSRRATVELTNASPILCLLATVFGLSVHARGEQANLDTVASDATIDSDDDLLDELRHLASERNRVNERIELRSATPGDLRYLRRIAARIDAIVAALRLRRPLRPELTT